MGDDESEKEVPSEEPSEKTEGGNGSGDEALKNELAQWKNDFLYLKADFENYKKRAIKERSELFKYAGESAFVAILGVLDNFERALKNSNDESNFKKLREGVELIEKEFRNMLQQFGVSEIPSAGAKFDPMIHDAVSSINSDEIPDGHIVSVLRSPYKYNDKVIRTGQVVVSLGPKKEESKPQDS